MHIYIVTLGLYALQFCLYHFLDTLSHFQHFRKSPVQVNVTNSQAILAKKVTLIIKPTKSNLSKTRRNVIILLSEAVGLISDIRFTFRRLIRDLLPFGVLTPKKGEKTFCIIQFSVRTMIGVTIAILDAT